MYKISVHIAESETYGTTEIILDTLFILKAVTVIDMFEYDIEDITYNALQHSVFVVYKNGFIGTGAINSVLYNGSETSPSNAGDYQISIIVDEGINYNANILILDTMTVNKAMPTINELQYTAVDSVNYDGYPKMFSVTVKNGIIGMGTITVFYNGEENAPLDPGAYQITISIDEGSNYTSAVLIADTLIIKEALSHPGNFGSLDTVLLCGGNSVEFRVVTNPVNGRTWAWAQIAGGILEGQGTYHTHIRTFPANMQGNGEIWLNKRNADMTVAYGKNYGPDAVHTSVPYANGHLVFMANEVLLDTVRYFTDTRNTPVAGDITVHVIDNASAPFVGETCAKIFTGTAQDENPIFYVVKVEDTLEVFFTSDTFVVTGLTVNTEYFAEIYAIDFTGNFTKQTVQFFTQKIVVSTEKELSASDLNVFLHNQTLYFTPDVKKVKITSMLGSSIYTGTAPRNGISISYLPAGIYIAILHGDDNTVRAVKFFKP
jgi:hypothetical protein